MSKSFGFGWAERKYTDVHSDCVEGWYTRILFKKWFPVKSWRFCIAKYDGAPYFLLIFGFVMFRFGKYWYRD